MNDNIIRFPGLRGNPSPDDPQQPDPPRLQGDAPPVGRATPPPAAPRLNPTQEKAIQLVLSGMPFVLVAVRPTDNGADFFTAVAGDATALRNAHDHLPAVIERAMRKHGIIT